MSFIITILIITSLIVLVRVGYKNTKLVNVKHVHINKKSSESKTTIHVLHISDMHLENISITPGELYDILKDEKIDLIALTGDFLDRKRSIPKMAKYLEVLNKLQPAYGSYAVFGNHDYVLNEKYFHELEQLLKQYGVKTMRNTNDTLYVEGQAVNIVGIDDYSTKRGNLDKSYENVNEKDYTLVLTHDPNIVLRMKKYHFDYFLSGHFHGGQIC